MKITYVTSNPMKIKAAQEFIEPLGIEVDYVKIKDLEEIQADTCEEVAIYSSRLASEKLGTSVLKNDSALVIPALKDFPGPYSKYIEETIGEEGILKLMNGVTDRYAYWIEVLAYTEFNGETHTFTSITPGHIAYESDGEYGWGYDHIFIPEGEDKVFSCFNDLERVKFFDNKAYIELAHFLKDRGI